ncbi:ATP-dependent DNA ligase [Nocardiopsis sp. Huas11]|uniref:ATP-dependent DNA ligase n=1 Tax=Nocardiopsis sp. Huas11 TaxID=2183912 RepID=UPI000F1AF151|nr:ATP-dependent DNA ligase [Nocardiopsis sp. Huas11]RKS09138.1 ATP-dependent DNA ligase [Nocardiopsis sp. Huas11]
MDPEPMLARVTAELPTGPGLVYEPKWDGFRTRAGTAPTRIVSRSGEMTARRWPELAAALESLPGGLLMDGEIVCWLDGGLSFDALLRRNTVGARRALELARAEPAHFVAFDLLRVDGRDIRDRPLSYRRGRLARLFAEGHDPHLDLTWQTDDPETAREWYEGLGGVGIEGLVVKSVDGVYESGRRGWRKYKHAVTTEAVVVGAVGSVERPQALVLGRRDPDTGELRVVGRTRDLTPAQREETAPLLTPSGERVAAPSRWRGGEAPPHEGVVPETVVEVESDTGTAAGKWRHVVRFVRVRPDLGPAEVPEGLDVERRTPSG